ncbi:FAD-binding domain-containing protein [Coprinellus micaceus]|uniref:FAD-binding domain-containing protein n=1 Tax=Coprinellus micaceus TaxID=71717 RepID=A0A4Y7SN28_COPMI|nr:FAD-binding domain-containing protein [Coprinellus micaceus]
MLMRHAPRVAISSALIQQVAGAAGYGHICAQIKASVTVPSAVYYPGDENFYKLSEHWAPSSNEMPACVVQPHTTGDVGKTLQIVGKSRTPFSVMSGGHATTPFLSSTTGVHISTAAFTSIEYDEATKRVTFGAGLKVEDLYAALHPYGVNVPGARVTGIGMGGFVLGGEAAVKPGYSWHTNQVGLAFDSVEAFELVKPSGEVADVTHQSDPELFFALKGGGNNFGIVTRFKMRTFPQGLVWGGLITFADPNVFPTVTAAVAEFAARTTDPKAGLMSSATVVQGKHTIELFVFYDGPEPPAGIFDKFMNAGPTSNTVTQQNFLTLTDSFKLTEELAGMRAHILGVSVPAYSLNFLEVVNEEAFNENPELVNKSHTFMLLSEPFLPSILSHNKHETAYPFTRGVVYTPFAIVAAWTDPAYDNDIKKGMEKIRDKLEATLVDEGYAGVPTSPLYPNYALWDGPLHRIYGTNLPRLQAVKQRVDPEDVMGLAGGFKIPPASVVRDEL